ncbi:MAG: crossover junction endodeoxyribonuclease RuvC [Phycisphaeraceae bacterium]|nr:MAG: crossover junction endodeoxyribonuclease RuvC [Phycisphaeraceae bacterium]
MRILGIDPGLRITGYGCIERGGAGEEILIEAGVVRLRPGDSLPRRLCELEADLCALIERLSPDMVCVEKLYSHYRHPTTAITMGHARGVTLLVAERAGVGVSELGATEVKKSLTGNGHAGKAQMQDSVRAQLGLAAAPSPPDVADAIAIALCAVRRCEAAR